jgi:hypothetical protein
MSVQAQMRGSVRAATIRNLVPRREWWGQQHLPAALSPGKVPKPFVQKVGWADLDDTKNLVPRSFNSRTVQPVASFNINWVLPATSPVLKWLLKLGTRENNVNCTYKIMWTAPIKYVGLKIYIIKKKLLSSKSVVAAMFKIHFKF